MTREGHRASPYAFGVSAVVHLSMVLTVAGWTGGVGRDLGRAPVIEVVDVLATPTSQSPPRLRDRVGSPQRPVSRRSPEPLRATPLPAPPRAPLVTPAPVALQVTAPLPSAAREVARETEMRPEITARLASPPAVAAYSPVEGIGPPGPSASVDVGRRETFGSPVETALTPPPTAHDGRPVALSHPVARYQVKPRYPAAATKDGIEGTTAVRVQVRADGLLGEVLVATSAGHRALDRAAVEAVKQWRFEPARRGDEAVTVWVIVPVRFKLE